ncbi:MAG: hypothetical protein K2Y39_08975 [Candidatus Obscuribacterales bacterium]|nr:hypothetical protein [Candidatus Obscuribacterales bacterium]
MMLYFVWILPLTIVSAMVLCWYFGAVPLLLLMPYFYEGCYAMGEDLSIFYGAGAFVHEIALVFLKKRLGAYDCRLAPVMVQTAVLFNAQAEYKKAEPYFLKAKEIYELGLNQFQQKNDKAMVEKIARELAQLGLDYASLLEVTGRQKDAPTMLQRVARQLEDKGHHDLAVSLAGEAAKYERK